MVCGQAKGEIREPNTLWEKATYRSLTDMLVVTTTVGVINRVLKAKESAMF